VHEITTPRLRLRLMSEEFLAACLRRDYERAERLIGLKLDPEWFREENLIALRLGDLRADPAYAPWGLRAIGLLETGVMIGHIGFHTRPCPDYLRPFAPDGIEFGYTVFTAHRRCGYALEAAKGLIGWAAREHGLKSFVVSIAPDNLASTALAAKLGFEKVGEHLDEVDGLELVYVLEGEALARIVDEA